MPLPAGGSSEPLLPNPLCLRLCGEDPLRAGFLLICGLFRTPFSWTAASGLAAEHLLAGTEKTRNYVHSRCS